MLTDAGLRDARVGVGARKVGDPFTVLIASGQKPAAAARTTKRRIGHDARTPPRHQR